MTISILSWNKVSFLAKLQLFLKSRKDYLEKIQSNSALDQAEVCSSLSSSYYSIVGTGVVHFRNFFRCSWKLVLLPILVLFWLLTWFPLMLWCYFNMLHLSNRVVKLIGYSEMTADQLDIRQSILRRRGRYKEARVCIEIALKKTLNHHTRGLLCVGLAEIFLREDNRDGVVMEIRSALHEAEKCEGREPQQASRIYRHCSSLHFKLEGNNSFEGELLRSKAKSLAMSVGAKDQVLKT
jgi:hypothetical protein